MGCAVIGGRTEGEARGHFVFEVALAVRSLAALVDAAVTLPGSIHCSVLYVPYKLSCIGCWRVWEGESGREWSMHRVGQGVSHELLLAADEGRDGQVFYCWWPTGMRELHAKNEFMN